MSAGRLCVRELDLAETTESLQAAAERMHARNVGLLVVLDKSQEVVGVVTDRDLVTRAMARGLGPFDVTVGEVMTPTPVTVYEDTPLEEALRVMRSGGFRRVPVLDKDDKLAGLLSLDDMLDLLVEEFEEIGGLLRKQGPRVLAK